MKRTFIILAVIVFVLMSITVYAVTGWYQSTILSTKENQSLSFVAGTVRQLGDGTWLVQNDADHTPLNIGSVEKLNRNIRINYSLPISKVVSLTITPDDLLAKKGYIVSGASVGLGAADFSIGRMMNIYGGISYSPATNEWILSYQNSNEYTLRLEELPNGVLRVWHPYDDFGLIPTQLTARDGGYIPNLFIFDPYYFDVRFYDYSGNLVTTFDQKCSFLFNRSGYRIVDVNSEILPEGGNFWVMGIMEN